MPAYQKLVVSLVLLSASVASAIKTIKPHKPENIVRKAAAFPRTYQGSVKVAKRAFDLSIFDKRDTCYDGASCQACFGAGTLDCPTGSYYDCYDPSNGIGSCSLAGAVSSSYNNPTAVYSSVVGYQTNSCTGTCTVCFGAGYVPCSGDEGYCVNPSDPDSICPADEVPLVSSAASPSGPLFTSVTAASGAGPSFISSVVVTSASESVGGIPSPSSAPLFTSASTMGPITVGTAGGSQQTAEPGSGSGSGGAANVASGTLSSTLAVVGSLASMLVGGLALIML